MDELKSLGDAYSENDIAIVGMAARLPGARNVREYWRNLVDGVESIQRFSDEELLAAGESSTRLKRPNYVPASGALQDMEMFDGEFFGFSPKESAIVDPQHRHFLEVCWEALEDASVMPERFDGRIGVFAGCGMGSYFYFNLCSNRELVNSVGMFLLRHTGNDKDFLATRVSYLLNLTGPSVNVQTACSTSLVAAHLAAQSLLSRESDLALAGGVTIEIPHRRGYLYEDGEILSPDGHCHAFDHRAQGTVFGSGAGVVVLRRLEDALAAGDAIYGVLKATAVNNDGSRKVGYLAPSVDGQAAAMVEAQELGEIPARSIEYVECHGTGTYMGDPIEVSALTQAFRQGTDETGFCRVGSVKTNIGHLDTAAGVASLIKATLAAKEGTIPPSLGFEKPNPTIDFESSPFLVNHQRFEWPRPKGHPRRAAVNSLGVGGTNAHAIVQEPPPRAATEESKRPFHLFMLAARNSGAVNDGTIRLADFLETSDAPLADVTYTLFHGRRHFGRRRVVAARDRSEALTLLRSGDPNRVYTHTAVESGASAVFMFPGGGSQYPRMAHDLCQEPVFKEHLDAGLTWLEKKTGEDYRRFFFTPAEAAGDLRDGMARMPIQLPTIFLVEYALAQLWRSWGVEPTALIGHSLGENTAACLAGVLSFEACLELVLLRGQLMDETEPGAMLSVPLPEAQLRELLSEPEGEGIELSIVNGPELCAVSGPVGAVERLENVFAERDVESRRLRIPIAAHSRLMDPILDRFRAFLESIDLKKPTIPFVSNRTGTWITDEQSMSPQYWTDHLRHCVRFADGVSTLLEESGRVLIEVGPGRTLSSLARQSSQAGTELNMLPSIRHRDEEVDDHAFFLTMLGRAWASGLEFDAAGLWAGETRQRIRLPTYAFQHRHYFIDPGVGEVVEEASLEKIEDISEWGYAPSWVRSLPKPTTDDRPQTWLFFMDDAGLGRRLCERVREMGHPVIQVFPGDSFSKRSDTEYVLSPERGQEGYMALVRELVASGKVPSRIVHLWLVTADESFRPGSSFFHRNQERGFFSLFFLAQALHDDSVPKPLHVTVLTNGMLQVEEERPDYPAKATVLGPVKVAPRELPGLSASCVDVVLPSSSERLFGGRLRMALVDPFAGRKHVAAELDALTDGLAEELLGEPENGLFAYRNGRRFERRLKRCPLPSAAGSESLPLREGGTYLVTGGLGGLGLVMAAYLADNIKGNLVLLGRSSLPPREKWDLWLKTHAPNEQTARRIRAVRSLETKGATVHLARADVTNLDEMQSVIEETKSRFGALHGVIHTAGVVQDSLISMKTLAEIEDVFTPKIHGTQVLDRLLRDEPLDFLVLFSSTSALTAPAGQVDYVAANAFLNAYAESRSGDNTHCVAINWGIWNEVGMAAKAAPSEEAGAPPAPIPVAHPFFDQRVKDDRGRSVLTARYRTKSHWLLDEHRTLSGAALIPGTGYLELIRGALREWNVDGPFEIRDLYFIRPLHVADDSEKEVRVKLVETDEGYSIEVRSACEVDGQPAWQLHALGSVALVPLADVPAVDLATVADRCDDGVDIDEAGIRTPQENHLRFGARWRVLKKARWGQGEALGELELPSRFASDLDLVSLHPGMMDMATGFAMKLIEGYEPTHLWVPVSYGRVRVRGPLPPRIRSWVRNHGDNSTKKDFASFDVTITDEHGTVLVEVEGFSIKRLKEAVDFAASGKPSLSDVELDASGSERQLSPAEEQLRYNLERGILPTEGADAFARVLASSDRRPVVAVTSLDLHGLIRQADQVLAGADTSDGQRFERPDLDSEYIEARTEVERTLVGFFEELLGVQQVGVRDSFFDLGGHSLIAVRLFSKIKKAYKVDFPISVLFEAPTVEAVASLIQEEIGESETRASSESTPPTQRTRYTHLVAMHPGEGGPKTPFFLVAGMFGNVLNLRHLAGLLGTDRRFYGLQARGLYGDQKPHETFEEMAEAYIAELRDVQPHGPYFLGGFSGGGITAFEMAQQLRRDGEEVALLVMLDTRLPVTPELTPADRMKIQMQRLQQQGPSYVGEWAKSRWQWELGKLRARFEEPEEAQSDEFHNDAIEQAFRAALPRYRMEKLPGRIILFRPKMDEFYRLGPDRVLSREMEWVWPDNGWSPWAQGIDVYEVPGDHDSMVLEPNVRVMVARLREQIETAEAAMTAPSEAAPARSTTEAAAE